MEARPDLRSLTETHHRWGIGDRMVCEIQPPCHSEMIRQVCDREDCVAGWVCGTQSFSVRNDWSVGRGCRP